MKTKLIAITILLELAFACTEPKLNFADENTMRTSTELSSQRITSFLEDSHGYIWMGTERGLNRYNGYEFKQFLYNRQDSTSLCSDIVTTLFKDSRDRIWVGTMDGVCQYRGGGVFKRLPVPEEATTVAQILETADGSILVNMIRSLYVYQETSGALTILFDHFTPEHLFRNRCFLDAADRLWSITPEKASCFNLKTRQCIREIPLEIVTEHSDMMPDGNIWIFGRNGKLVLNTETLQTEPFPAEVGKLSSANDLESHKGITFINTPSEIYLWDQGRLTPGGAFDFPYIVPEEDRQRATVLFIDSKDNLWLAGNRGGFSRYTLRPSMYQTSDALFTHIGGFPVMSGCLDTHERFWYLSDTDIIHVYYPHEGFTDILSIAPFRSYLSQQIDQQLIVDSRDRVWLRLDNRLLELKYHPGRKGVNGYLTLVREHNYFPGPVMDFVQTDNGELYAGVGLDRLYRHNGVKFEEIPFPKGLTNGFFTLKALAEGRLAIGSFKANPVIYRPKTGEMEVIPIWEEPVPQDFTYSFMETPDGNLWIGTRSSGLFRYSLNSKVLTPYPELPFHSCQDILQDHHGNIWVSTDDGLFRLNKDGAFISAYHKEDGLGGNQFTYHTAIKGLYGKLIFAGQHGLTVVNPDIYQPRIPRNLVFEDFQVGNRTVVPAGGSAIPAPLSTKPHVRLGYRSNSFSVKFLDLNPGSEESAHYFYKLEGYDKDWIDVGSSRQAHFNNIPAGKYEVRVRIARSDRQITEAEASFPLSVLPAPWATWWAKLVYLLLGAGALYLVVSARRRILLERKAREQEAFEKEQERRVNDMNMRFFANISHEFRTPLTMISGPVGLLEKTEYIRPREQKLVETIHWNAARMLRLVNQLMDFNKLENDALRLKVSENDLVALVRQTLSMFRVTMQEKKITLHAEGLEDTLSAVVDPDKVDKVLSNLLSNAVKYTPEGGNIFLKLDSDGEIITLEVADDGPSIPQDQLERVFERYFQVEDHHNYGTGIGLYYARRLMQLHHGSIHAENLPKGVKFIAEFPAKDVYKAEEHVAAADTQQVLFPVGEAAESAAQKHEQTLLVVDDDPGIVNYLKLLLASSYNIIYAYNADDALRQVEERRPDLILSDVSMPGMDGYELCRRIKADEDICHLPVILVTAKTTTNDQIAGLNTGADAYVTKPFDPEYLLALIHSQLENRARLRRIVLNATTTGAIEEQEADALNIHDKELMDRLYAIMEEELSNEDLNVNALTERLLMSRTKLYYKVKGLTGETPNAFFKKYKLNRAAEMLKSGNYNISEVSDLTGFSAPTVFTRNFKAHFGVTPTEYMKKS